MLNRLFSHFDILAERYGLETIKTIGDAYTVAAGVPEPRRDHARAVLALDMVVSVALGGEACRRRIGAKTPARRR